MDQMRDKWAKQAEEKKKIKKKKLDEEDKPENVSLVEAILKKVIGRR